MICKNNLITSSNLVIISKTAIECYMYKRIAQPTQTHTNTHVSSNCGTCTSVRNMWFKKNTFTVCFSLLLLIMFWLSTLTHYHLKKITIYKLYMCHNRALNVNKFSLDVNCVIFFWEPKNARQMPASKSNCTVFSFQKWSWEIYRII